MTFHVGQMVVCVDDADLEGRPWLVQRPSRGCVYQVRAYDDCPHGPPAIYLCEVVNPVGPAGSWACSCAGEPGFFEWRFRPVKTTSIKCFTDMLAPIEPETV